MAFAIPRENFIPDEKSEPKGFGSYAGKRT